MFPQCPKCPLLQYCVEPPSRSTARSASASSVSESLPALSLLDFLMLMHFLMISARKQKTLSNIPTNHIPRGRWKCSIARGSGLFLCICLSYVKSLIEISLWAFLAVGLIGFILFFWRLLLSHKYIKVNFDIRQSPRGSLYKSVQGSFSEVKL